MSTWTEETDFISVGGGIGGLTGALIAHDAGLQTLVLEKSTQLGGVAALSLGQVWVPANRLAAAAGIADSIEAGHDYMEWVGGGFARPEYVDTYLRWGAAIVHYLGERGDVVWRMWRGQPDYYYPAAPRSVAEGRCLEVAPFAGAELGSWATRTRQSATHGGMTNEERSHGSGSALTAERAADDRRALGGGLVAYLVRAASGRGIDLRTNAEAVSLVRENGRVAGVVVRQDGRELRIRARCGVLIATSGYDWSPEMVCSFDARSAPASLTMREVTGDHFRLAGALGARVVASSASPQWVDHRLDTGGRLERVNTSVPGVIMVDRHGARFADESFGPSFTAALAQIDVNEPRLAHQPFWAIFDDAFRVAYPIASMAADAPLPPEVITADTIEELAHLTGIDVEGLVAEVDRFNRESGAGIDPRFGRGTRPSTLWKGAQDAAHPTLGPLVQAPFHAAPLITASIGIPVAGLAADTMGRVLDWEDQPIAGLYVAGNSMALLEAGVGYQSGYANTRGMVFAALAAAHAAGTDLPSLGLVEAGRVI